VVETLREHCERHAREWEATAEFAITQYQNEEPPRDFALAQRQAARLRALCLAHAEEWRARARRCAR
jgi:hypothetical protein